MKADVFLKLAQIWAAESQAGYASLTEAVAEAEQAVPMPGEVETDNGWLWNHAQRSVGPAAFDLYFLCVILHK